MDILNLIETRIPNLHESLKKELYSRLSKIYPCKKHILYSEINVFKKENNIIAVGKFTKKYWISRGWADDDAIKLTKLNPRDKERLSSPMTLAHWLTKINPSTSQFYTEDEASFKIKSHRKLNIEYWINRGYSQEEAKIKVSQYQKENGNKFSEKNKKFPEKYSDRTWTQINYWINLGYSQEEATQIISTSQDKTSIASFVNRYGEDEGKKKYATFIKKLSYGSSVEYYINKYGKEEGQLKYEKYLFSKIPKTFTSKESIKFFIPIYKELRKMNLTKSDIFWGIGGSREYYMFDKSTNSIFFYDFCIPKLKKIIEYHGTSFHPNPNWKKEKFDSWNCLFLNLTAEEKLKIDQYKENFARKKGYSVLCIWSDDIPTYDKIIDFLIK